MSTEKPESIAIDHDDYHAQHIGTTQDGNQFFLTTPFEAASDTSKGCEYIALFIFDSEGECLNSIIESLGPREDLIESEAKKKYNSMLSTLGEVSYCRIVVKPFSVDFNGTEIGLIARAPEDEDDEWAVELLPGNYMAFFEPWDSGEYDT